MEENEKANQPEATVVTGAAQIEGARQLAVRSALKVETETGMKRSSRGRSTRVLANEITGQACRTNREAYAALNEHIVSWAGQDFDRPLREDEA